RIQRFDVRTRRVPHEDILLDLFQLGLEAVDHREIAIDHRVDQRIEHETRAVLQEVRLALAAGAYTDEAFFAMRAYRKDVIRSDENVDLADDQLAVPGFDGVDHREQRVAVFLDLWPGMALTRILDGQFV